MKKVTIICLCVIMCLCLLPINAYAIEDTLSTTKSFTHNIYFPDGGVMCKLHTTISGNYSYIDKWSEITKVTCYLSHQAFAGLTVRKSISGNKAYVHVGSIATVTYKLSYNGGITSVVSYG